VQESIAGGQSDRRLAAGRYVLGARLGGGGSADVYQGVDTRLERPVAVKLFRPGADDLAEQRFQEEARLLGPLEHPALVTIYDTGVEEGRAFQVLQLVDGVTLRERLIDGPLPADEVRAIGVRLAEVLAYVHSRGIVHRDVKPSNIMVGHGADGSVFLADFGISRLLDSAHLTATGLAIGTAAYMAPEQVRGGEVGPAADIYSLGLVLLESLTGQQEYPGATVAAAVARLSRPPLIPTRFHAPLPSLLAAMTRDDPAERPSAQECAAVLHGPEVDTVLPAEDPVSVSPIAVSPALDQTATTLGAAALTGSAAGPETGTLTAALGEDRPPAGPGRRRAPALVGLAVLGLAAALVGGWLGLAGRDAEPSTTPSQKPTVAPSTPGAQNPAGAQPDGQPRPSTSGRTGSKAPVVPGATNAPASPTPPPPTTEPTTEPTGEPSTPASPEASASSDDGQGDEDNSGEGNTGKGPNSETYQADGL
jgi:serine/threonine protein kinase